MSLSSDSGFHAFDPERELDIRFRNLPHWFQAGTAVFVTFRTADSLPREVVLRMQRELKEWLRARRLPLHLAELNPQQLCQRDVELTVEFAPGQREHFQKLRTQLFHHALDECHGACHLKNGDLRKKVAEAILFHDGTKYELDRFVVMPNHVHVIVKFSSEGDFKSIGQSWMRFSARKLNEALGLSGPFWQAEPFDHLIRSSEQFQYLREYVSSNPLKANLKEGEWFFWSRS